MQAREGRSNTLTSGHRACQGCGEALGARYALDAAMRATERAADRRERDRLPRGLLDPVSGVVVAAPVDPLAVRERARRGQRASRRRSRSRDATSASIAQGGDGGTVDIGFGCLSGMFERGDDVLYICYDNEAYMNTGVQRLGRDAARRRGRPTRSPSRTIPATHFGQGKSVPLIAMAHEIPYVATATVAELHDLEAKVERAMSLHGPRYLHVLVPCPLGWGAKSADTILLARLAKESGLFPVFEAEHGEVTAVSKIRRQVPVEEYLRLQRRFAHLFGKRRGPTSWSGCRRSPTATSDASGSCPRRTSTVMEKPFAITLDVGSSRANKTGSWRTERPVYVDRMPPCNHACPAGENIQAWLYEAEEGGDGYERAWRRIMEENPFPAIMGRVCYHPCETACNRATLDEAVGINEVERFLGDLAIEQGWTVEVDGTAEREARARRRRRPVRPLGRLPPRPPRPRGDGPRRRAEAPAG